MERIKRWELNFVPLEIPTSRRRLGIDDVYNEMIEESCPICEGRFDTYEDAKIALDKLKISARLMKRAVRYILIEGYYIELREYEIDKYGEETLIEYSDIEFAKMDIDESIIYHFFKEIPKNVAEYLVLTNNEINYEFNEYLTDTLNKEDLSWNHDDLWRFWDDLGFNVVESF
ncbi:MAG: hypothetical protein J6I76_16500 [Oribacterium sp.]|nr:hypothetical protein [Oribacterium sp.]